MRQPAGSLPVDEIDDLILKRKKAHKRWQDLRSPVYAAFQEMERCAYSDGALPKKHKELVAVGISVVINCESCMQWHIDQAAQAGATENEVLEAIEVGIEMGGGPATAYARFALEVMERVFGPSASASNAAKTDGNAEQP